MPDFLPNAEPLSAAELDRRLEKAVQDHERAEKLICFYLYQIKRRRHYVAFGFENIYDYAMERFSFCYSKTRSLLYLARKLTQLPRLTAALASGKIGWTKAAKAASQASPETDEEWTEKAVNNSFRDLERLIRDETQTHGGKISIYLTAEQASIWTQALELVRRVSGEEIDTGLALEYIAAEFLATYQARVEQDAPEADGDGNGGDEADVAQEQAKTVSVSEPISLELDPKVEALMCPDGADLPSVEVRCYAAIHKFVLERDGYLCQYPGCAVRYGLHVHHLEHRSKFGKKKWWEMNDPSNLLTICWFHHRMLHAGLIGLSGKAPVEVEWRRPKVMETATERHERLAPIDVEGLADTDHDLELEPDEPLHV